MMRKGLAGKQIVGVFGNWGSDGAGELCFLLPLSCDGISYFDVPPRLKHEECKNGRITQADQ